MNCGWLLGIQQLQSYLVDKIQELYRARWSRSTTSKGHDSSADAIGARDANRRSLEDEQVDGFCFVEKNEKVMNRGGEPVDKTP